MKKRYRYHLDQRGKGETMGENVKGFIRVVSMALRGFLYSCISMLHVSSVPPNESATGDFLAAHAWIVPTTLLKDEVRLITVGWTTAMWSLSSRSRSLRRRRKKKSTPSIESAKKLPRTVPTIIFAETGLLAPLMQSHLLMR